MLTVLIFAILVFTEWLLNLIFSGFSFWQVTGYTALCVVSLMLADGIIAFICGKVISINAFNSNNGLYKVTETERKFWEKTGIRRWKDKCLELGKLNGFSKKNLGVLSIEYIDRFIWESNRGILNHFLSTVIGFLIILAVPDGLKLTLGLPSAVINAILNVMPLAILRYNKPKLIKTKELLIKRQGKGQINE